MDKEETTHDVGDSHHYGDEHHQGAGEVDQEGEGDEEDNSKHEQHIPASRWLVCLNYSNGNIDKLYSCQQSLAHKITNLSNLEVFFNYVFRPTKVHTPPRPLGGTEVRKHWSTK